MGEEEWPFDLEPRDLQARWAQGDRPVLLDVREPFEYKIARLPDAVLVPLGELAGRVTELDPACEMVVYCHHGIRSARAVSWLRQAGFERARNLRGGIDAWTDQVDASVPRY